MNNDCARIISESEMEDFRSLLNRFSLLEDDFSIECTDETVESDDIFHIRGSVKITAVKRNIYRIYPAGSGTAWVVQFSNDLENQIFGCPQT